MRLRCAALLLFAVASCQTSSRFVIELDLKLDDSIVVADVTNIVVSSNEENYSITLPWPNENRTQRLLYNPDLGTTSVVLTAKALDENQVELASGTTTVATPPAKTAYATILLGPPPAVDQGVTHDGPTFDGFTPDGFVSDGFVAHDLTMGPDLTVPCDAYVSASGMVGSHAAATTITLGLKSLTSGQTLCVDSGTYNESVVVSVSGTTSQPTTIRAYDFAAKPKIVTSSKTSYGSVVGIVGNHIRWDGIDIGPTSGYAVSIGDGSTQYTDLGLYDSDIDAPTNDGLYALLVSNLVVQGNTIHDNTATEYAVAVHLANVTTATITRNALYNFTQGYGVYLGNSSALVSGVTISHNTIYDNSVAGILFYFAQQVTVDSNLVYHSSTSAIGNGVGNLCLYFYGEGSNITLTSNIVAGCGTLFSMDRASGDTTAAIWQSIALYGNTFIAPYASGTSTMSGGILLGSGLQDTTSLSGFTARDNVFEAGPNGKVQNSAFNGTDVSFDYDAWSANPGSPYSGTHDQVGELGLVNDDYVGPPGMFDATKVAPTGTSSIVVNNGTAQTGLTTDYFGNPRDVGGGYDIGAIELQ